jgi:hypothetical protein
MRMKLTKNEWLCAGIWIGILSIAAGPVGTATGWVANAQTLSTTTVQGTVYLANGQPGAGTIDVSWPSFTTANGLAVAAGRMTVTIAPDGFMSVNLAPNQGATPAGLYYTAVYHRSDGTTSTEYWVVPSAAQAALGQVRAQLMPAAQAVQTVSKAYVDQSIAELTQSLLTASGGTLSGPLYLNGDPTQPLQAADKHYVDAEFGTAVPLSGGSMTGALTDSSGFVGPLTGNVTGNVSGTSTNVTGVVQPGNGGTGAATAAAALANLGGLPLAGGTLTGALTGPNITATQLGGTYQVDRFPGVDFGAQLQACLSAVSATFGGICDARNFTGSLSMGSNLTISTANATVLLPCATISTANQVVVTAGTRNVALKGCALRGASTASGSQGGTVFLYSGAGAMVQVGDPAYAADTNGFHLDNVAINTTAASNATAQGLVAYRTQEMDLESLYFLGNSNQTGMTLDGTGNYTGGTFLDNALNGFQTAVNAIGHQVSNPATTDWMNASTFARLHIDCPTSGGNPIAGTYGINLQQGDGNTFTGGDVEGCSTALHLGVNAQNNTIVGLRNENSTSQVVADAGSAYNNWMTGGTMFTGKLTDNGTRNSFLDTFHRSFNGMNGDWYGSQFDGTVTNHYRVGIGTGNERGLLNRYQTDYGYRWTIGLSDATAGEQYYQVLDELNSVYRLSIGQYNHGQSSTNNQTVINAAGTGAVVLNGSNNSGTGGVVFGSGGATESTVATVSNAGNAQFNGTLLVGGTSQSTGTMTVRNNADAEVDYYLWPGLTASQKGSFTYKDWNGNSQWYMVKDASNNWALNSATGGLDSFKAYQSSNSGDTYINASNSSGVVRVNYETGSGAGFNIYGGGSSTLYASFTGAAAIKFPGLAAGSGHNCLQIDTSGYITNTGSACGTGSGGGTGTVSSGTAGQIAYYTGNGTSIGGISAVPVSAGGTGASTSAGALANLGAQASIPGLAGDGAATPGILVSGNVAAATATSKVINATRYASQYATGGSGTSASPWTGWETAVTTAPANSHIHFPAGYYSTATGISPAANGLLLTGDGSIATVITATAAMPYVVGLPSNGSVRQLSIRDMYFEANNLATYGIFDFDNTNYDRSMIENVGTSDAVSHGVVVRRCQMCTLRNVSSWTNGGHGFSFEGANASVGIGLTASGSARDGFALRQCTDTTGNSDCGLVGMTLQAAVTATSTTMTVDDASYLPVLPATFNMAYTEQVTITAATGNVLTVTRGANSTTPTAWPAGTQMTGVGGATFSGAMTLVQTQSEANANNGASINTGAPVVFTGGWFEGNGAGSTTAGDGFRISGPNVVINGLRVTAGRNSNASPSIWAVHLLPGAQNAQIGSMMVGSGGGTGDSQYYAPNIDASLSSGTIGPFANNNGNVVSPLVNIGVPVGTITENVVNAQQLNMTSAGYSINAPYGVSINGSNAANRFAFDSSGNPALYVGAVAQIDCSAGRCNLPPASSYGYTASPRLGFPDDASTTGWAHPAVDSLAYYSAGTQLLSMGPGGVLVAGQTPETQNNKGAVNGYAPLNSSGQVPAANLPVSATSNYLMTWSSPAINSTLSGSASWSIMRTIQPITFKEFSLLITSSSASGTWTTQPNIEVSDGTNTCILTIPNSTYSVYGAPTGTAGTGCSFASGVTLTMYANAGSGGTNPNPGRGNFVATYCMTGATGC